jgi:hypothetical protein
MGLLLTLTMGCQSTGTTKKLSKEEKQQQAVHASAGRAKFWNGQYVEAAAEYASLIEDQTVDQPLYLCELSSIYLLDGRDEEAHQVLLKTHESIEGFFDESSEKKAASLWGSESEKVFKGDPHERATLYALLSLSMLERGETDNALAALKTGMLADSDSENDSYKADYGLLQYLAAKCYQIRGEPELSAQMLEAAFTSFLAVEKISAEYGRVLVEAYESRADSRRVMDGPSKTLVFLCSMASEGQIMNWMRNLGATVEEASSIAEWAKQSAPSVDPIDFNTLIVVWDGRGPGVLRSGEYGEIRMVVPGTEPAAYASVLVDGVDYDAYEGFGEVTYQAITRGGRKMDNVLSDQAAFKGTTDSVGNASLLLATQDYGDPMVNVAVLGVGLIFKGIAAATTAEADVRYWGTLPNSFDIVPVKLAPGDHEVRVRNWFDFVPLNDTSYTTSVSSGNVSVLHVLPGSMTTAEAEAYVRLYFTMGTGDNIAVYREFASPGAVDTNGDFEFSKEELEAGLAAITLDVNGDGIVADEEIDVQEGQYRSRYEEGLFEK